MARITIVIPWFGEHCRGGAERLSKVIYDLVAADSHDVEVTSTTSKSFDSDWSSGFYQPGLASEDGYCVRRFAVSDRKRDLFDAVNARILRGEPSGPVDQHIFLHHNINSLDLNRYICSGSRDIYIYLPYLYGPTLFGLMHNRGRNLLVPLLHDEGYAKLGPVARSMRMADCAIFLSQPEKELFFELYGAPPAHYVIPVPIDAPAGGSAKPRFAPPFPYILYAGRKDAGKNIDFLFDVLERLRDSRVGLVLIGGGEVRIPPAVRERTLDLGYVSENDKQSLMHHAVCLLHPSLFESFSITVAEANACGAPVIVHEACRVLRDYVTESRGGVVVSTSEAAEGHVRRWLHDPASAAEVGRRGAAFVQDRFSLSCVRRLYQDALQHLLAQPARVGDEA